ncbi:MAG: dipeptide epimerase [Ferruginibacter sp.]|nr:dipeptide epimerase [Cytophagales bacterium]
MKIKQILVRKENLELTRPYTIAFKTTTAVENCIVEIVGENGLYGLGAANPSKEVVGESVGDAVRTLSESHLTWLVGRDVREFHLLCDEAQKRFPKHPGACAALDIALHDLFAKYLDVPLVQYLGQKKKSLPTSITIGIKGVPETLAEADEYLGRGFRIIKLKLGTTVDEDAERLEKLHEHLAGKAIIRIDLNQAYTPATLEAFFYRTQHLNVELIEQPLSAHAVYPMKKLPDEIKNKIAADESLLSPKDAFELACTPAACGIFNIKLMKSGGIGPAREIAAIADHAGISLMWGCNDESIISITAALHAAFSCENTKYLDLDGSLDLARDVVSGGFILKDGRLSLSGKPGLGVSKL